MWRSAVGVLVTLTLGMLAGPLLAHAQPTGKLPRIGILAPGSPPRPWVEALRQGLRELGYVEGQSMALDVRWDEDQPARWPALAAELVALPVDLIVTGTGQATGAAQAATPTIPIVMAVHPVPVERGHVASLARPGGNITGQALMSLELSQKQLELLKDAVPRLSRVAVLWHTSMVAAPISGQWSAFETAARVLGLALQRLEVGSPADLDGAFEVATREGVQAMLTADHPFFATHKARVAALGLHHRLPTMSGVPEAAEAGCLMSYGPNIVELWRRAAVYVAKILKGAKPADLPVEQPTTFELVLNLKTPQALGLTLPPGLLVLADKVIQ